MRTDFINIRCSATEKESVRRRAEQKGQNITDYLLTLVQEDIAAAVDRKRIDGPIKVLQSRSKEMEGKETKNFLFQWEEQGVKNWTTVSGKDYKDACENFLKEWPDMRGAKIEILQ